MSNRRRFWQWLEERKDTLSFAWPQDTNLTREQMEIAVQDGTPSIGWQPGPTPVFGAGPTMPMRSLSNENYDRVWIAQGDHVEAMGVGDTPQEAAINYAMAVSELLTGERCGDAAETWIERARPGSTPVLGGIVGTQDADGSTVVWSDGPAVYGHGETAGAAMRDYAESVIDVRDIQARYGDAFDGKAAIRAQQAHAECGDCGDGHEPPPDYEVMKAHLAYLKYCLRHKWYVFLACRALRVPLWQAVLHDWSKFLPGEWFPYARYFYGPSEPPINYGELFARPNHAANVAAWKEDLERAFDAAWLHHQHASPHHWQYWVLREDDGGIKVLPMPDRYAREMVADWMGAGRALGKPDTRAWYEANKGKMQLHSATRALVERLLEAVG